MTKQLTFVSSQELQEIHEPMFKLQLNDINNSLRINDMLLNAQLKKNVSNKIEQVFFGPAKNLVNDSQTTTHAFVTFSKNETMVQMIFRLHSYFKFFF